MPVYPQIKRFKLVVCSVIKEFSFKEKAEKKNRQSTQRAQTFILEADHYPISVSNQPGL